MPKPKISNPAQLTTVYVVAAMAWIVGSDLAVVAWKKGDWIEALANSAKGAIFVTVSGAVLYAFSRQMLRNAQSAQAALLAERRAAHESLARTARLQATLARANQAALDLEDPDRLCAEICSVLVENAGVRLAWIGWEDAASRRIIPAQRAGPASHDFDQVWCSSDPSDHEGGGPTGRAVMEKRTVVSQDIANDPSLASWRDLALSRGLHSCAAMPLGGGQGRRGALSVYAGEKNFFDADCLSVLEQLAKDLRHGLEVIAVRREMQRQTEALRASEERWQFALEGAGDGVWDWNVATGEVFYSPRLMAMLGYGPKDFTGRVEEWEQRIHPEDRPRVTATLQRYLNGESAEYRCEHRLRAKDGSYRWILDRGRLMQLPDGRRGSRMIGTHSDITAQKDAEEQLHLVQAALQAAPVGVMITDRSGRIAWVNAAFSAISGYAAGEAIGANPRLLKSSRQDAAFFTQLWQTILRGETWRGELINLRPNGTEYTVAMTIAPVRDGAETIAHFVAVMQDVTEQRQLEQQFLRAQRLEGVGHLASGIAHDLNNVLAPILLSVELLKLKLTDPGTRASLDMIDSAARRGAGILRQVLTFARGVDGERVPLRPTDVVRELVAILDETFPRHIRIEREVASELPLIQGDATQMHQMLLNLAINARDAMEQGGTLLFRVQAERVAAPRPTVAGVMPPGDYVVFAVCDTGRGISPEVMARIFEPFFTTKPKGKGTGLGLASALGIVRSHRGYITVKTSAAGSEFAVFLPAEECESVVAEHGSEPLLTIRGDGRLLLVCDDEASIRDLTVAIFQSRGFRIVVASDGLESVQLFAKHRHELTAVVLDLMMPGCTGIEVLAEIRKTDPRLPVLLSSGLVSEAVSAEKLEKEKADGPTGMIQKPYTAQALLDALGRLLERAKK